MQDWRQCTQRCGLIYSAEIVSQLLGMPGNHIVGCEYRAKDDRVVFYLKGVGRYHYELEETVVESLDELRAREGIDSNADLGAPG